MRERQLLSRKALKTQYLECLEARSPSTLRQTVRGLLGCGVRRDLLLAWAVAAGHERKYVGKLLSECLTALGIRQRRAGAGRRTEPPALLLLAFAHDLFGNRERKCLRAAWRAATGVAAARLEVEGLGVIPEPELYTAAVERFARKLTAATKQAKTRSNNKPQ